MEITQNKVGEKVKYLYIHASDTPLKQAVTPEDIHKWHIVERGWTRVGYNDLIGVNGEHWELINLDDDGIVEWDEIANGVQGDNSRSYHICIAGGRNWANTAPLATMTGKQAKVVKDLIFNKYLCHFPWIKIRGHYQNENTNKTCPNFDVTKFLNEIGVPKENIDLSGRAFPL